MPSCDQRDCACTIYVDPLTGREISEEELKKIRKSREYLEYERKRIEKEKKEEYLKYGRKRIEKEKKERKAREIKRLTAELKEIKAELAKIKKEVNSPR